MKPIIALAGVLVIGAAALFAQQPRVSNGQVTSETVTSSLERTMRDLAARANVPEWIGYAVPSANPDANMCCWSDGRNSVCNLEPGVPSSMALSRGTDTVRLETGAVFFVLYRIDPAAPSSAPNRMTRIRTFSDECAIDAGGRAIHWLTGVKPAESVAFLNGLTQRSDRKLADAAIAALSMHAEPSALEALVTLARAGDAPNSRSQALFWLAQRAGQKAVGTITEAIDNDPDTDVKKRAVFALSQLPPDQGVPMLITVARTNPNPAVKKQAIFWLGQSKDPRALKFFEEILFK